MTRFISTLKQDSIIYTGIWMAIISGLILLAGTCVEVSNEDSLLAFFFLNYVATVIYTIIVFSTALNRHGWRLSKSKIDYTVIMLILWFISAFALNRLMNVFDDSVQWLSILLVMCCMALIGALFIKDLPLPLKHITFFILGLAIVIFAYYSFSLIPLYLLSVPASIGLGISLHSFTPLCLAIVTITVSIYGIKKHDRLKFSIVAGLLLAVTSISWFTYKWKYINDSINKISTHNTLAEGKLPNWVLISQAIPKGVVSERIIKSDLVYKTLDLSGNWLWGGFMNSAFDEKQQHDPLVVLASLFVGKPQIDQRERIKILESMYDSRHQAQERLWSGDKLKTHTVISNVRLMPEYRMAYTEKILTISNKSAARWNLDQEAVYTFHLPEGSVVSSLSLWINGKEEKGYLTTKAKADSAYRQVVGVEQHDPSVIHWQEGNTVSVRVFPCTPQEDRRFKIGITSPLRVSGTDLVYGNIYFDGPSANEANEALQLSSSLPLPESSIPKGAELVSKNVYQLDGDYQSEWELRLPTPSISSQVFSFDGKSYQLSDAKLERSSFSPEHIYLDINSGWTKDEFLSLWKKIKTKNVYVFDEKLVQLDEDNKDMEFHKLSNLNFSLFPLYKISTPSTALLISKSNGPSPNLSDLKGSEFSNRMEAYLTSAPPIHLYFIGEHLSPYLQTLKELRVFQYQGGELSTLFKNLDNNTFTSIREDSTSVTIAAAKVSIREITGKATSNAPDHLLRLYAYNHIMKKVAGGYFKDDFLQPETIAEAEIANIVSPVSSLIVLETKQDYERFGIEESKNSLKNASMKSSGAVPEPHEWMLILLTGIIVLYLLRNKQYAKKAL
ncbi:XrtN system VIT domain-containing protein [Desertivirga arenae]|uniref:XrtN system VIT domain-containing protein n=1 Tax=Desertivirga arenae TaxID=2810309 RepID=UPI001A97AAD6|nr:XrtN system VIT domain-containing protein [Pedobacter sp. SYSU D00823]